MADFDGDGINEKAIDANNDGSIDPTSEIIATSSLDESFYGSEFRLENVQQDNNTVTIKPGPLPEVRIAKPVAYAFMVSAGFTLAGAGIYLAAAKMMLFSALFRKIGM